MTACLGEYARKNFAIYDVPYINYIERALVNINAAQSEIIADYAASCLKDMASCYNQQMAQLNSWSAAANTDSIVKIMASTCRNVALTCGYAVFHYEDNGCDGNDENKCINDISNVFYQSQLCPENSSYNYTGTTKAVAKNNTAKGQVNATCICDEGYRSYSGKCVADCPENSTYTTAATSANDNKTEDTTTGIPVVYCACNNGYTSNSTAGTCTKTE